MSLRSALRALIPAPLVPAVRTVYRSARSGYHAALRSGKTAYDLEQLKRQWADAEFAPGGELMVHSALSRIGNVAGGAETVIRSVLETVTESGTVLMPCYHAAAEVEAGMQCGRYVDLRTRPSETGKITEMFRTWPGVRRSSHPFSSVCAWGRHATAMLAHHAEDPRICHARSPVGQAVERNLTIVGIGIPIAQGLGVAHCLEDTWEGFPLRVYAPPFRVQYTDFDGNRVERDVIRLDPEVSRTRIDHPEGAWICARLTAHFKRIGLLREFDLGDARCWAMPARPLYDELKRLAQKGVTMYLTEGGLDDRNRDPEQW